MSQTITSKKIIGASGNVLRSEIVGAIKMRVYLSGMPELRLGLNDKVYMTQSIINEVHNEKNKLWYGLK